jgi:atypical dual specificity phosphatase
VGGNFDRTMEAPFIMRNLSFIDDFVGGSHKPGMSPSNLNDDLIVLKDLGITMILSMSDSPLDDKICAQQGIKCHYFSVKDYYPPSLDQFVEMMTIMDGNTSGKTLVHCNAGMGRTGTVLAAWLVYKHKIPANEAIETLRSKRKGSVQTFRQEDGIKEFEVKISSTK